jgi:hypothetical protein
VKRIIHLDKGKLVHLDSYREEDSTLRDMVANFFMAFFVAFMAAMTTGAIVGVNITDPKTWSNQDAHRISR